MESNSHPLLSYSYTCGSACTDAKPACPLQVLTAEAMQGCGTAKDYATDS